MKKLQRHGAAGDRLPAMKPAVISRDSDVMGGAPVFAGTRLPVQTLLDYLGRHHRRFPRRLSRRDAPADQVAEGVWRGLSELRDNPQMTRMSLHALLGAGGVVKELEELLGRVLINPAL